MGEAVPSPCGGGVRVPLGSAGRGLQGGGGGRGLSGARGRGLDPPACGWRWAGFGGTCGFGPGSGGLLLGGVVIVRVGVVVVVAVVAVVVAPGSSGGPVSMTRDSSAPPSKEAGPEDEWVQGPGSELGSGSASSAPWWPHGEQDGSRERLFVIKLGLEEEGPVLRGEPWSALAAAEALRW